MKIRNGFVSNSSGTCFVAYGVCLTHPEWQELRKYATHLPLWAFEERFGDIIFGVSIQEDAEYNEEEEMYENNLFDEDLKDLLTEDVRQSIEKVELTIGRKAEYYSGAYYH